MPITICGPGIDHLTFRNNHGITCRHLIFHGICHIMDGTLQAQSHKHTLATMWLYRQVMYIELVKHDNRIANMAQCLSDQYIIDIQTSYIFCTHKRHAMISLLHKPPSLCHDTPHIPDAAWYKFFARSPLF